MFMEKLLIISLITLSSWALAGLNDPPLTYQDPCVVNPNTGDCHVTTIPNSPFPNNPIPNNPTPIGNPMLPTPTNPQIGLDWSAECKVLHSQVFGNRPVSCPTNHYKDNGTCGCNPNDYPNVCAMCGTNTCGSNFECANPTGAGSSMAGPGVCSFVCLGKTDAVSSAFNKARAITLSRFNSTSGLNHYGAVICDIFPNATDLTIHDSLKDPVCKRMYRALSHASNNGIIIPETPNPLSPAFNTVIKDIKDIKLSPIGGINGINP